MPHPLGISLATLKAVLAPRSLGINYSLCCDYITCQLVLCPGLLPSCPTGLRAFPSKLPPREILYHSLLQCIQPAMGRVCSRGRKRGKTKGENLQKKKTGRAGPKKAAGCEIKEDI